MIYLASEKDLGSRESLNFTFSLKPYIEILQLNEARNLPLAKEAFIKYLDQDSKSDISIIKEDIDLSQNSQKIYLARVYKNRGFKIPELGNGIYTGDFFASMDRLEEIAQQAVDKNYLFTQHGRGTTINCFLLESLKFEAMTSGNALQRLHKASLVIDIFTLKVLKFPMDIL